MPSLQAELNRIAIRWNIHANRKQRAIDADPDGLDVMYFSAHLYICMVVVITALLWTFIFVYQNLYSSHQEKCSPAYIELAMFLLSELTIPTNPADDLDIYFVKIPHTNKI